RLTKTDTPGVWSLTSSNKASILLNVSWSVCAPDRKGTQYNKQSNSLYLFINIFKNQFVKTFVHYQNKSSSGHSTDEVTIFSNNVCKLLASPLTMIAATKPDPVRNQWPLLPE